MTIWAPDLDRTETGSKRLEAGAAGRALPIYRALAEALARDVESGVLEPHQRLPTQRDLARRLGIALTTVTRGYAEAERRGLISSQVGRGTFVCGPGAGLVEEPVAGAVAGPVAGPMAGPTAGPMVGKIGVDLRGNSLLPWPLVEELRGGLGRLAATGSAEQVLGYAPHAGLPRHRAAGARLASWVGVPAEAGQMLVTAGAQHAMTVVLASLLAPGDTLLVEELTYAGIKSLAHLLRLRLRPVAMDREGLIPEALREACAEPGVKALYCIPVLQNPTAAVMSAERAAAVAAIAGAAGVAVVEDDTYGFLLPRAPRLAALLPGAFWLTGTSKSLLPALRIGFLRVPMPAAGAAAVSTPGLGRLEAAIAASVFLASPYAGEAVARWVDDGTLARVQDWKRRELAARQRLAAAAFAGLDYRAHPLGSHGWLALPEPWTTGAAVAGAERRGVHLLGADVFSVRREAPHAVRVCVGPVRERATLATALGTLAAMLRERPEPGLLVA